MRKFIAVLFITVIMAYVAGCGGSSTTTTSTNTTIYSLPVPPSAPFPVVLGGAVQGVSLTLTNSASIFSGSSAGFSDNAVSTSANFNHPIAITTDGINLYVADYFNNAIRQIVISSGAVTTIAGSTAGVAGSADGIGTAASFRRPRAITSDASNLYVTDSGNHTIRKIDLTTKQVTTLAGGIGMPGTIDAIGLNARFNMLNGITTDGTNLYVTDSSDTIRRILISDGSVSTLAGSPGKPGSADGIEGAARFNQPASITTDGFNLYVADFANRTIRKIALSSGVVTTIAGKSVPGSSGSNKDSTDGTGHTAEFKQPNGITCDGFNLYVTDSYDNMVRKIVLSSATVYSGPVSTLTSIGAASLNSTIGITTDGIHIFVTDFTMNSLRHTIQLIQ